MARPVRIGLVGTSWYMDLAHLPMLKADSRAEIVAICGRNRTRAQEMATKYGVVNVFTDYRDMIARSGLDAILIATPDDQHYEMTMTALDAGLHVLCEKPLAMNAHDAKAMYEKAEAKGVRHMSFFTWRWMPHYHYLRELIEQGDLGRLYQCQFSFICGAALSPKYHWRYDPQRANGALGDFGSHMFDLARHLVGDIVRVNARLTSSIRREGLNGQPADSANDSATAMIEFAAGAQGTLHVSLVARIEDPIFEQQVILHGEKGSVIAKLGLGSGPELHLARGNDPLVKLAIPDRFMPGVDVTQPFGSQLVPLFTHQSVGCRLFVDAILEQRAVVPSFYEGWKAQQLIDAAKASHESGQWISV